MKKMNLFRIAWGAERLKLASYVGKKATFLLLSQSVLGEIKNFSSFRAFWCFDVTLQYWGTLLSRTLFYPPFPGIQSHSTPSSAFSSRSWFQATSAFRPFFHFPCFAILSVFTITIPPVSSSSYLANASSKTSRFVLHSFRPLALVSPRSIVSVHPLNTALFSRPSLAAAAAAACMSYEVPR